MMRNVPNISIRTVKLILWNSLSITVLEIIIDNCCIPSMELRVLDESSLQVLKGPLSSGRLCGRLFLF